MRLFSGQVPQGATQLRVELTGDQQAFVFGRFGQPVVVSNGNLLADFGNSTASASVTITLSASSSPPLVTGTVYLRIGNNGPGALSFTLTATVSGVQPTPTPTPTPPGGSPAELAVDDGSFESVTGLTNGGTMVRVNRLTPPRYPATLSGAAIYFSNSSGLSVGTAFDLLVGTNPDGDGNIDGVSLRQIPATAQALGRFNVYAAPSLTITSGDFIVGIKITH
ncbi:MAG: hypothetical protein ACREAM_02520, partial [Blastocatellia bacterium]